MNYNILLNKQHAIEKNEINLCKIEFHSVILEASKMWSLVENLTAPICIIHTRNMFLMYGGDTPMSNKKKVTQQVDYGRQLPSLIKSNYYCVQKVIKIVRGKVQNQLI